MDQIRQNIDLSEHISRSSIALKLASAPTWKRRTAKSVGNHSSLRKATFFEALTLLLPSVVVTASCQRG